MPPQIPQIQAAEPTNELGWFEFETRIRQMMLEMLGPVQKRIYEGSEKVVKFRSDYEGSRRKIEDLEFHVGKIEGRLVAIDDIYKRFNNIVSPPL